MQIVLDTRFSNLEQFMDEIQHWDLDFRLLGTGGFSGKVKQLVSRDVLITYARFKSGLDQSGTTPPGYRTFVIPGYNCNGFWWRGHHVTRDDLLLFPRSSELQSASHADFEVFTISINATYLEKLAYGLGIDVSLALGREVIHLDAHSADNLRHLAGTVVKYEGGTVAWETTLALVERLVICTAQDHLEERVSLRQRDLAVDRIVQYVRSTPVPTSQLAQLCRIAKVSERTLQYAFKERYGISPNVFVKRWKLNSARRLLLMADSAETAISAVAASQGFLHQGQFATEYRTLFSELPSKTLSG